MTHPCADPRYADRRDLGDPLGGRRGRFPAIDLLRSVSRSLPEAASEDENQLIGEARRLLPRAILLLPGIGAQGAGPADVARAFTSGPASALLTASRSILYAFRASDEDWRAVVAHEAARLRNEVWTASGW